MAKKEYTDSQEVLNDMQPILDSCAQLKNYIDGIAFLLNATRIAQSQVPGEGGSMETKVIASMISNFEETAKDTFGESTTDLQYVTFMKQNKSTQELSAWSIVFFQVRIISLFLQEISKEGKRIYKRIKELYQIM